MDFFSDMAYEVLDFQAAKDCLIIFLTGCFESCAFEPSERGAGIAFSDDLYYLAKKTIRDNKASFINHDQRLLFINELEGALGESGYSI